MKTTLAHSLSLQELLTRALKLWHDAYVKRITCAGLDDMDPLSE